MKIKITYQQGEEKLALAVQALVRGMCPGTWVRDSDRHPPFFHKYITTVRKTQNKERK